MKQYYIGGAILGAAAAMILVGAALINRNVEIVPVEPTEPGEPPQAEPVVVVTD